MKWAYGLTTVPERFNTTLPGTLLSLSAAGFSRPKLFIDGASFIPEGLRKYPYTLRSTRIRTFGNWVAAAWELYAGEPTAERFALFQDDLVAYSNLRAYLDTCTYPPEGYWNLYTFPENVQDRKGWYPSNQLGKGAVALVFSNEALRLLLQQQHMVDRPLDAKRGWKGIDGGIVSAMRKAGWKEYVHNPSLVQHTGIESSMGNKRHELASTFRGEHFDARSLLDELR